MIAKASTMPYRTQIAHKEQKHHHHPYMKNRLLTLCGHCRLNALPKPLLLCAIFSQSQTGELNHDSESEEAIRDDEHHWDAQFAATQSGLKKIADKVRADIQNNRSII